MNNENFENILDKFEQDYYFARDAKSPKYSNWPVIQELVKSLFETDTVWAEPKSIFYNKHFVAAFDDKFSETESYKIELHAVYPHLIARILTTENIEFSHNIDELFMYCYNKRFVARDKKIKYRLFTNLAYGLLSSDRFGICVDSSTVTKTLSEYIKEIVNSVKPSLVGLHVDELFITDYNDYVELQKIYEFSSISTLKTGLEHQIQSSDFMNRKMSMIISNNNRTLTEVLSKI